MTLPALDSLDVRIPRWNLDALQTRVCPFCAASNDALLRRPDQLPVAHCRECGCWYIEQIPPEDEIHKFYEGYWHGHHPSDLSLLSASNMRDIAKRTSQFDWQIQTLSHLLGGLQKKRVLEIGCGLCQFLLLAREEGAEVVGCDLSPEACSFAEEKLAIPMFKSEITACAARIGPVDAIIMRDLIEHPFNPMNTLNSACGLLKPGGLLLLLTPNGGAAGTDADSGAQWVGFRVDLEHLQYLSTKTVNWLAQKKDLGIERLDAFGFPKIAPLTEFSHGKPVGMKTRALIKGIPGSRKMVQIFRTIGKSLAENHEERLGSYHLYAVLRKS
jgi:SAM-dependent methyltransferase